MDPCVGIAKLIVWFCASKSVDGSRSNDNRNKIITFILRYFQAFQRMARQIVLDVSLCRILLHWPDMHVVYFPLLWFPSFHLEEMYFCHIVHVPNSVMFLHDEA